jgi:TBC1 domain family member 14
LSYSSELYPHHSGAPRNESYRGENRAALEVAKREGTPLDGGKYEIYGVDEESLWDRIDHMDDWWKESTWTRLIQRELPDA